MKERPILFSVPMVRAILEGRKTQTRRVVKLPTGKTFSDSMNPDRLPIVHHQLSEFQGRSQISRPEVFSEKCPHGTVGDRLWVREAWTPDHAAFYPHFPIVYRADRGYDYERNEKSEVYSPEQKAWFPYRWRPSIHMPRWASRLTLEITGVRVERLQEITPKDAIAEGFMPTHENGLGTTENFRKAAELVGGPYPRGLFAMAWNQINGPESWAANPWVWVIEFRRIEQ